VIDPVSAELIERGRLDLPWRRAFAGALALHLSAAAFLLLASTHHPRPLYLPNVKVRIGPLPIAMPARSSAPPAQASTAPAAPQHPAPARPPERKPAPKSLPSRPAAQAKQPSSAVAPPISERHASVPAASSEASSEDRSTGREGGLSSPSGTIGLGQGATGIEESFPHAYYLTRMLGLIESNWFRPDAPAGTKCRLRCRVDRNGRLLEAGLEEASAWPAFDRAALRAIYASAPFPPLPQGYTGAYLTIHLEFGP
jgi:TonB family protein